MAANLDNKFFPQPNDINIPLWRYMDLSKYAALLQTSALVFPRADILGDPFEGSLPLLNATAGKEALRKSLRDSGMSDDDVQLQIETIRNARIRMIQSSYVSCWHLNESESAAMWKLYSKSNEAVCIRTEYNTLSSLLPSECDMGVVNYLDFNTEVISSGNLLAPLMVKRRSFRHEREARAVIWNSGAIANSQETDLIREISLDLSELLKGVYVSPEAPAWFANVVADLTSRYGLNLAVEQSELSATPLY